MTAPTTPAYEALLDAAALQRLRALDPDGRNRLLPRVLGTFRASLERLLPQLRDSRHDAQALRHATHTLKSSSASVGALHVSQLCAEIEQAVRQGGGLAGLDATLDELAAEAERLIGALPAKPQ